MMPKTIPDQPIKHDDDESLTFGKWCEVAGFSRWTGNRIRKKGGGPVFRRVSDRVETTTYGEHRRWRESCERV
jgi:hypothetical protein